MKPLSMAEVDDIAKAINDDEDKEIHGFLKKFAKLKTKEAKKMREELENLNLLKLKGEHIAKIMDLLPEDSVDINKIFIDISLDDDETNKILEVVKKYN